MVTYGVRLGDAMIDRYPDLNLQRQCDDCLQLRVAMNSLCPGDGAALHVISQRIVRNANRHALKRFGETRAAQQAEIASAIADLLAAGGGPLP